MALRILDWNLCMSIMIYMLTFPRRILEVAGLNLGKETDQPDSGIHT